MLRRLQFIFTVCCFIFSSVTVFAINGHDSNPFLITDTVLIDSVIHSICEGEEYEFNGEVYTETGSYSSYTTRLDTVYETVLRLHVQEDRVVYEYAVLCIGEVLEYDGNFYQDTGTYDLVRENVNDLLCPPTYKLVVTEPDSDTLFQDEVIYLCPGETIIHRNIEVTDRGFYTYPYENSECYFYSTFEVRYENPFQDTIHLETCFGDSAYYEGVYYGPGLHTYSTKDTVECSFSYLSVSETERVNVNVYEEMCPDGNFTYRDSLLWTNGTHQFFVSSSNGSCDSIINLHLTDRVIPDSLIYQTFCSEDEVSYNGFDLKGFGRHLVDETGYEGGCTQNIYLVAEPTEEVDTIYKNDVICRGDVYEYRGKFFQLAGTYEIVEARQDSCDIIYVLALEYLEPVHDTIRVETCEVIYTFRGKRISEPGIYYDSVSVDTGCDSLFILDIKFKNATDSLVYKTFCPNEAVTYNGQVFDGYGEHLVGEISSNGCNRLIFLIAEPAVIDTIFVVDTMCVGVPYFYNDESFLQPGEYTLFDRNAGECGSNVVLLLLEHFIPPYDTIFQVRCEGESFELPNGEIVFETGIYEEAFDDSLTGCPNFIYHNVIFEPKVNDTIYVTQCEGEAYAFNDQTFTDAGFYEVGITQGVCPGTQYLLLEFSENKSETINIQICDTIYFWNDRVITESGTYVDTIDNDTNCPIVDILNIELIEPTRENIFSTVCGNNDIYFFYERTLNEPGVYMHFDTANCVFVTLTLEKQDIPTEEKTRTICKGDTIWIQDTPYFEEGEYHIYYDNLNECDSICIMNLVVSGNDTNIINETICKGESFIYNNESLTEEGVYTFDEVNETGCPILTQIQLKVVTNQSETINIEICDTIYFWNGRGITESGTYTDTLDSTSDCPNVQTLNIKFIPTSEIFEVAALCGEGDIFVFYDRELTNPGVYEHFDTSICAYVVLELKREELPVVSKTETICRGDTLWLENRPYFVSGDYEVKIFNPEGCDTICLLNLKVTEGENKIIKEVICEGDSYVFNNEVLTTEGVYVFDDVNEFGCAIETKVFLEVIPNRNDTLEVQLCEGEEYVFGDKVITESGKYERLIVGNEECQNYQLLYIRFVPQIIEQIQVSLCEGDVYELGNQVITQTGEYKEVFETESGCDSIVYLYIEFKELRVTEKTKVICEGDSFKFGGQEITESGIYVDTLEETTSSCATICSLKLRVVSSFVDTLEVTICRGAVYFMKGEDFTEKGIYFREFESERGCDSSVVLKLNVVDTKVDTIEASICEGDFYTFGKKKISESGSYTRWVEGRNCPTKIVLNLSVFPTVVTNIVDTFCIGTAYQINDKEIFRPGDYVFTFETETGCDSIVKLSLHGIREKVEVERVQLCEGSFLFYGGKRIGESGVYDFETTKDSSLCPTQVKLIVEVVPLIETKVSEQICEGDSIIWGEKVIKDSGVYTNTFPSKNGCDSLVTLFVRVVNERNAEITKTICAGEFFEFAGRKLTERGVYVDTLSELNNNCLATITLTLEVLPSKNEVIEVDICEGDFYNFNNQFINKEGVYRASYSTRTGCDSVVTLKLTVHDAYRTRDVIAFEKGDSIIFGDKVIYEEGFYQYIFSAQNGCDSLVSLYVETYIPEIYGCMDATSINYNPEATIDNGTCIYEAVKFGCTFKSALNYDPEADIENGSCKFERKVWGCTDSTAVNYDASATRESGNCEFRNIIYGCTDPNATNFKPRANKENGSCRYFKAVIYGCTDPNSLNYNPNATHDNNSCLYEYVYDTIVGCTDSFAINYDISATVEGDCYYEGEVDTIWGCLDPKAVNYNQLAEYSDSTCVYAKPINTAPRDTRLSKTEDFVAQDTLGTSIEFCNISTNKPIDSVFLSDVSLAIDGQFVGTWEIHQDGNLITVESVFNTKRDGKKLLFLNLVCKRERGGFGEGETEVSSVQVSAQAEIRSNTTPIKDVLDNSFESNIFPNPSNGEIFIETNSPIQLNNTVLSVYAATGVLVHEEKANIAKGKQTIQLSATQLPTGVYLLQLNNPMVKQIHQIVVK